VYCDVITGLYIVSNMVIVEAIQSTLKASSSGDLSGARERGNSWRTSIQSHTPYHLRYRRLRARFKFTTMY
jgi:hypothetical protein